ncbi:ATP-dependent helicase [Candidatus Saccharibacteria bacterium]|nr:ATP-dependent helicase [Candidatus Saccharibacteria bacterium]
MSLNAKQKEAVEYIQGPLLVLAGPGTGKTFLLSNRVEYILENTDANPENILCLTFTESGASNMRERLLTTVGKAARRLEIHTYHGFGSDLLMEYKNYATEFVRNLDQPIDEVKQYKIVKEIQEGLPATDILRTGTTGDIVKTIQSAKAARLTGEDCVKIAQQNEVDAQKISAEVSPILKEVRPRMKFEVARETIYEPMQEVFAKYTSAKPLVQEIEPIANSLLRELKRLVDAEAEKEKPSVQPLSTWRGKVFELDESGEYRLKTRVANRKLESFGKIMTQYNARLEKEGLFDFADMIEQAIRFLKEDKGFRLTLQEKFQYVMLDEFQDTNPSQFELVKLLTDYEQPNVMAVGDDDQAIFEFQGADASNLLTFQQHYGAKVINLQENYRSNQEILDLSRRVADQIEGSFAKSQQVAKNLTAAHGAGAEVFRDEFLTSDMEYEFVAKEIEKLVDKGVPQKEIAIIAPKHKYIAPLLPFLKETGKINVAYERRENLLEDPRLSEILTLARFVYGLSQGKNVSSRLLEILSYDFWQLNPAEAIACVYAAKREKKSPIDFLTKAESPRLREIGEWLAVLAMKSFDAPLELMLDYLVGTVAVELPAQMSDDGEPDVSREGALRRDGREFRCPFVDYYDKELSEYGTFELYENLAVLKQTIVAHVGRNNPRLKDLVEMLDDYELAGAALINASPYRDSEDAVQIVTAHKAKGLEYEYVFLIATDNLNWGKAKGNNTMFTLPRNVAQIRHTGITDDERLRLLFVAITRAKRVLFMTNSLKDFAGKSPARLDYLEEYEEQDGDVRKVVSPFVGEVRLHYGDLKELRRTVDLRKTWRAAYTKLNPELKPILLERMKDYKLSASDLTSFIDVAYAGPMAFYASRVLKSPQEPATGSMIFGTLVHAVFERVTKAAASGEEFDDEAALKFYREEAEKADLEPTEVKYLLEKGEASLKISLKSFREILRDPQARAEVNLASEHPEVGGVPALGVVDHMRIDEEKKEIEIYDFKTGKYYEKKWGSHETLYKYMLQLGFYKLAIESCPSFKKYKVRWGHILFVTPDEEGKVYDKVLDFEKDLDEEELKAIVRAVYKQATTLEFLEVPELKVETNREAGLKGIREFIQLLLEKTAV